MDKFLNNTPQSSSIDSMMEKFHAEVNKHSKEDLGNRRKLTIESPFKIDEDSSHSVDQRLTDLESLIKRLQNEITDMSNSDGGSVESEDLMKSSPRSHNKKPIEVKKDSHIYHLAVKDVMKESGQCSKFTDKKSEDSNFESQLQETYTAIRQNFSLLWDGGEVYDVKVVPKKEDK